MLFFFFWRDVGMEARTLEPIPEGFDLNTRSAKHSFDGSMLMWRSDSVGESLSRENDAN
jgi:hypothetical protein